MLIQQAMAVPRQTTGELHHQLQAFLNDCLNNGFIVQAMLKHGVSGAEIADNKH
jgi:hypothetical protein